MDKKATIVEKSQPEVMRVLGCEVRFPCRGEVTANAWSLMECAAPRDAGPPPHHHDWDEAYYVVEGEVRFSVDGRERLVKQGDFLYLPAGVVHGFCGASDQPARILIFDAPAHAEGFFRDAEREVRSLPSDLAKVPAIGERHGIHFVPRS